MKVASSFGLLALVYDELPQLAGQKMAGNRRGRHSGAMFLVQKN
jgi:hypothetical protein